ncbi:MAG: DUF4175 family protein [Rhodothermales bacterium]
MASNQRVLALVRMVRQRLRRRALIQGVALTLLTMLFFVVLYLLVYLNTEIDLKYLIAGAALAGVAVLYVAIRFIVQPLLLKMDDRQVALFVEEKIPGLEDRLNSAVEVNAQQAQAGSLLDRLIEDAVQQVRAIPITTVVDRKKERIMAIAAGAGALLFLVYGYYASDDILSAFSGARYQLVSAIEQPLMSIAPGTIEIERGATQEIIAEFRDASEAEVFVTYRTEGGEWRKEPMQKGLGQPVYLFEFADVQAPLEYFVQRDELQSDIFSITLYAFPEIEQIDLRYTYPAYTGLPPRVDENRGDIRGLKGAKVTVSVRATGDLEEAALVMDSGRRLPLQTAGDGVYRAELVLDTEDMYHVELNDRAGKQNKFPDDYLIVPEDDESPRITITDPQQDVRVNAIEEVVIAARAEDDYGVKDLRLRFSVNGADEETVALMPADKAREQAVSGDYVFFLEDYELEPGDVISYYVEAEDFFAGREAEASDMYFIEVAPFDRRFTQANNMGGGGGGGGMQSRTVVSQQEIIAATWKLHRQRNQGTPEAFQEAVRGLVQAQTSLKESIEEKIGSTAFSLELRDSEESQKIVEYLRNAIDEMDGAIDQLDDANLEEALAPERRALNHLLRADALNRDRQVAMNRDQQGGGGGGGGSMEDRMTELMDLELDISRDKYEMQQQQSPQAGGGGGEQAMDDALQRIKELARKQQRLANQREQSLQGEDKKRFIERLKRDQDELRQQAEDLAQQMQQMSRSEEGMSRDMQQGLQRAIDNMREAERALRNGDDQQASAKQQQALNELDQLQQDMRMAGSDSKREMLDEFVRDFEEMREQEERLGRDIASALEKAQREGRIEREKLENLQENRESMRNNLDRLKRQAESLEAGIREEDPEAATTLRNMLQQMRRDDLEKNMDDSQTALDRGWVDFAERVQDKIDESLRGLTTQARELQENLPQTDEDQLRRALSDLQDIRERMQEAQERAGGQQPSPNGQQQGQQQSQQGQQQGQQQGDPGQQGQQQGEGQQGQQQSQQQGQGGGQGGERARQAQAARLQQQARQAQETLERLQEQFGEDEGIQRSLSRAQQSMRRVGDNSFTGVLIDEESAKDFFNENVYDPLSDLEMLLSRQLDDIEMEKKLYGSRNAEVPDEYRDAVDRYYESLSKSKNE